jgi:hypothetical protein
MSEAKLSELSCPVFIWACGLTPLGAAVVLSAGRDMSALRYRAPMSRIQRNSAAAQAHSKDFPVVSTTDVFQILLTAGSPSRKDRLRNSNRPLMSALHSGPRVSRALAPRSLGSVFRS